MRLSIAYDFLPRNPTPNTQYVMNHFGVASDQGRNYVARDLELDLHPGDVALFIGPSGSGKSSLLRESARQLISPPYKAGDQRISPPYEGGAGGVMFNTPKTPLSPPFVRGEEKVVWLDRLPLPNVALADALGLPIAESLELLSACGLSEAQIMLRTPAELSDGQKLRFRFALAVAQIRKARVARPESSKGVDGVASSARFATPFEDSERATRRKLKTHNSKPPPGSSPTNSRPASTVR